MSVIDAVQENTPTGGIPLGEVGGKLYFTDAMADYSHLLGVRYRHMAVATQQLNSAFDSDRVGDKFKDALCSIFPVLNIFSPSHGCQTRTDRVTSMSFHPHLMQIAVAVSQSERSIVRLYDLTTGEEFSPLCHAFLTRVQTMEWKPQSKSTLVVGCEGGFLVWNVSEMRCLFYPCGKSPVTSLSFCRGNRLIAAGSEDLDVYVHNLELAPHESLICVKRCLEGSTAALRFSSDNRILIHCCRQSPTLTLWHLQNSHKSAIFHTGQPVLQIFPFSDDSSDIYAIRQHHVEGVTILRILPHELVILARISTSDGLVGGRVTMLAAGSQRLFTVTESGNVLVFHVQVDEKAVSARCIGSFFSGEGALAIASSDCFPNGTMLAVTINEKVVFVPCYHVK